MMTETRQKCEHYSRCIRSIHNRAMSRHVRAVLSKAISAQRTPTKRCRSSAGISGPLPRHPLAGLPAAEPLG
ncbi:unnamed protein product [Colias eurytheme]|nr:unnamed protein product [Colias eurytheme]